MTGVDVALGTENGLRVVRVTPTGVETRDEALAGEAVRSLAVHPETDAVFVGCGLRGWGLHRWRDGETTRLGFDDRWVWGVSLDPRDSETVYVGTEPPALYRSRDGGASFTELSGLTDVPSRDDWTFYHEPFGDGHVHAITLHPDRPDRLVAGVEDGPVLVSTDGGETWREALTGHDVHRIAVDPRDPDRWLVGAEDGLFVTDDAGDSWTTRLSGRYVHGVRFVTPDRVWAYAADASPVLRSDDGGRSWTAVGADLPPARAADPLVPVDRETAIYAGGETVSRIRLTTDGGDSWRTLATDLPKVWRARLIE
ncbi:MAG: hypothetical protein ABEI75_01155 [Halobaculum sp.]